MAGVTVIYKGDRITTIDNSGIKTLETAGKYCEDDIIINYNKNGNATKEGNSTITVTDAEEDYVCGLTQYGVCEQNDSTYAISCNNGVLSISGGEIITTAANSETLTLGTQTATVENLYSVGNVRDRQEIVSGKIIHKNDICIYDGTQPIGDKYISSTGTKENGAIIIYPLETEYTGTNLVSFTETKQEELNSLEVGMAPIQDLHGYDHPWAAGAGNNKAYWPTLTNSSSSDVGYTILDDGNTLHVEGTASANSTPWAASLSNTYTNMPLGPYPAGTYTIIANGLVGQNTNDRIAFTARYADNSSVSGGSGRVSGPTSTIPNGTGKAVTFTATDEFKIGLYMVISSGTAVNCDVKIQLEKASSLGSWEPYANVCPITGWTGANISRTGKNLFDEANATVYKRYIRNSDDKWMGDSGSGSYAFPCKPDTDYVVSANNENLTIFRVGYANVETLANGIQLYNVTRLTSAGTIQIHTGSDATYIIVQCNVAIVNAKNTQLQIEYGTTASAYEAYISNTYAVDWTSAAGTVYAGTYDAVSGKLKARPQYSVYNGETLVGPWLSSMDVYEEGATPTTGAQVVDMGGTETTHQLTPQEIKTFIGTNNIWSNDIASIKVAVSNFTIEQVTPQPLKLQEGNNTISATNLSVSAVPLKLEYMMDFVDVDTIKKFIQRDTTFTSFTFPSGITKVGNYVFADCTNLNISVLPNTITSLGDYSFYNCTKLNATSLPSGITSIGQYCFFGCLLLALTSLPSGITQINAHSFRYCSVLALTSLPSGVTIIGAYAFNNCESITSMSCSGEITSLGSHSFTGSSSHPMSLESASFPNMVATDLSTVFGSTVAGEACQQLTVADIGKTASISANSFANCYKLQTLILRRTNAICTLANTNAFTNTPMSGYNSLTGTVYVPNDLISTYQTATNWSTFYNNGTISFVKIEGSIYDLS